MGKTLRKTVGIAFLAMVLWSCTTVLSKPGSIEQLKAQQSTTPMAYHLGVGDEVEVKFFFAPELNDRVEIRPDGKISLMFAQDVQAAGLTPEELASAIKEKLSKHVRQSDLVVTVRNFASQKVFVGGEVVRPGPVLLTGRENVMQVLAEAGWMTPAARTSEVVLVRRDVDGKETVYPINVHNIMSGQDASQNVYIEAGDILLVPPSGSIEFDRWIDQNIRQALPFGMTAGAYYTNQTNGAFFR